MTNLEIGNQSLKINGVCVNVVITSPIDAVCVDKESVMFKMLFSRADESQSWEFKEGIVMLKTSWPFKYTFESNAVNMITEYLNYVEAFRKKFA